MAEIKGRSFPPNYAVPPQETLSLLKEEKELRSHKEWLKKFPTAAIAKFGWLPKEDSPVRKLKVLLNFFGVAGVEEWIALWQSPQAAYRSSVSFQKNPYAVAAWLRQGE